MAEQEVTQATQANTLRRQIVQAINALSTTFANAIPRVTGSFTLAASASTTVADVNVTGTSRISFTPTNAAAGTLEGSAKCLYVSARSVGVSFTVTTASGAAAAGTETFDYFIVNPV